MKLRKYQCQVCGHVYDPAKGEPKQKVPPGVDFKDLPKDWTCPVCRSPRHMYEPL